jgi:endoglucanase
VDESKRVATVGKGGVLSLLDRSTIYDRDMIDFALDNAKRENIPVQVKRYVSGGNDAAHIQKSGMGVRCMAFSAPTRYLHAPVSVAAVCDYEAMRALVVAMLKEWRG